MNLPLLGLVMIVKDEALTIESLLQSYRPFIDCWTILDTGSTDRTIDIIIKTLSNIVPNKLYEEPFVDFSTSKNRALDLHGDMSMFTIMPAGRLVGGKELRHQLELHRMAEDQPISYPRASVAAESINAYRVQIEPNYSRLPLVLRAGAKLRYKGRTHEYVDVDMSHVDTLVNTHMVHERWHRTPEQWKSRWENDLRLLSEDASNGDVRAWFYLGQTFECLGNFEAALNAYGMRAGLPGYYDETYLARYRVAKMMEKLHRGWPEIMNAYLEAYRFDPRRAEPLYYIAERYERGESFELARMFAVEATSKTMPDTDLSFSIEREIYEGKAKEMVKRLTS